MPKLDTLADLFVEELRDLHSAESQLLKAIPALAEAASDELLKVAFENHARQTKLHLERLERIFEKLGESPHGRTCKAMKGLIAEGREHIKAKAGPAVKDAALIAAAQRIEHYEIAGYGTARTFATLLGHGDAAALLQQTLEEEGDTDQRLTLIAQGLNVEALSGENSRDR